MASFNYGHGRKLSTASNQSSNSAYLSASSSVDDNDRYYDTISTTAISPTRLKFESYRRRLGAQGLQDDSSSSSSSESDDSAKSPGSKSSQKKQPLQKRFVSRIPRHANTRYSNIRPLKKKKPRPAQLRPEQIKLEDLLACANKALRKFMRDQTIVNELLSEPISGPLSYLGPVGCVVRLLFRAVNRDETLAAWHARRNAAESQDLAASAHSQFALPDIAPGLGDTRLKVEASAMRASKPGAKPKHIDPDELHDFYDATPETNFFGEPIPGTSDVSDLDSDDSVWDAIAKSQQADTEAPLAMPAWQVMAQNYSNAAEPHKAAANASLLSPPPVAIRAWRRRTDFGYRRKSKQLSMATITESDRERERERQRERSSMPAGRPSDKAIQLARERNLERNSERSSSLSSLANASGSLSKLQELSVELLKSDQLNVSLAQLILTTRDALLEAEDDIAMLEAMNEELRQGQAGKTDKPDNTDLLEQIEFHRSRFESCQAEFQSIAEWASYLEAAIDQSEDRDLIKDCAAYYFVEGRPARKSAGEPASPEHKEHKAYYDELGIRLQGMARAGFGADGGSDFSAENSAGDTAGVSEGDYGHSSHDSHGDDYNDEIADGINDDSGSPVDGVQGENMADWFPPSEGVGDVPGSARSWSSLHSLHSLHSQRSQRSQPGSPNSPIADSVRHSVKSFRESFHGSSAGQMLLARSNSAGSNRPRRAPGDFLKRPKQLDALFRMQEIQVDQRLDPVSESAESVQPALAFEPPALLRVMSEPAAPISATSNSNSFAVISEPKFPAIMPPSPIEEDAGFIPARSSLSLKNSKKARARAQRQASKLSAGSTPGETSLLQNLLTPSSNSSSRKPRMSSLSSRKHESFTEEDLPRLGPVLAEPPIDSPSPDSVVLNFKFPAEPVSAEIGGAAEVADIPEPSPTKTDASPHGDLRQRIRARREERGRKAFIGVALPSIYQPEKSVEESVVADDHIDADATSKHDTHLSIAMQSVEVAPASIPQTPLGPENVPETVTENLPVLLRIKANETPAPKHFLLQIIYLLVAWVWRQKTNAYIILHWYSVVYVQPSLSVLRAVLEEFHTRPHFQLWDRVMSRHQLDEPDHDPPPPYSPHPPTELPSRNGESSTPFSVFKTKLLEKQNPFPIDALADLSVFVLVIVALVVLNLAITERNLWVNNNASLPREYLYSYIMHYDRETGSCATNPYMFSSFFRTRYSPLSPPATHSPYHICACLPTFVDPMIMLEPMGNSWVKILDMLGDYWQFYSR